MNVFLQQTMLLNYIYVLWKLINYLSLWKYSESEANQSIENTGS